MADNRKRHFRAHIAFPALVFAACLPASSAFAEPVSAPDKWRGWGEVGSYFGTDNASRGEVAIFAPLLQSETGLLFTDVRGKLFEEDNQEGNAALGYRHMLSSGWNLGVWGGLDLRNSQDGNSFWQAAGGFEALSENWDVRVNGYLPLSDPKNAPSLASVSLSGSNILMTGGKEIPLYGVDGEVGVRLFSSDNQADGSSEAADSVFLSGGHELRLYGGGFWFDGKDAQQEVTGVRTRLEYRVDDVFSSLPGSRLTLEGEFSYDEVRRDKWEVGARLRLPFGGASPARTSTYAALTPQSRRMTEGLERDTDVVTAPSGVVEAVIDNATNVTLDRVALATDETELASGVGLGANTLIVAQKGVAAVYDLRGTDGQALQASQTILGGGGTIKVRGATTGTVTTFTAAGARPTFYSNDGNSATGAITAANNTHIAGLEIKGGGGAVGGNFGILSPTGVSNVMIEQNDIWNNGHANLRVVDNTSNVTISNNIIRNAVSGFQISDNNTTLTVSGNTFKDINTALSMEGGNAVSITGNSFKTHSLAIVTSGATGNTLAITDNTFAGAIANEVIKLDGGIQTLTDGSGNVLAPGATVNGSTTPTAADLCTVGTGFTGTFSISGTTIVDAAGCVI